MPSEDSEYFDLGLELSPNAQNIEHIENTNKNPHLQNQKELQLEGSEKIVYNIIKSNPSGIDFDTLTVLSGIGAAELPAILLSLVLEGAVSELSGKIYKPSEAKL